jgi:uncharacterized protein YjeT (DUF2065 family)
VSVAAFIAALGLLIAAEGLAYAAFPGRVREALAALLALPEGQLRGLGLAAAAFGLALVGGASLLG